MNLIETYYAVEICEDGIWRKPAHSRVDKKWLASRVRQLEDQGWKVRVKQVREFVDEEVIEKYWG